MAHSAQDELYSAFTAARARVPGFVERQFGLGGTLWLHRHLAGPDLIAAPINLFMSAPALIVRVVGFILSLAGFSGFAAKLGDLPLFLPTRSGRELACSLRQNLLNSPEIEELLVRSNSGRLPVFQERTKRLIDEYLAARTAFAEFSAALFVMAGGFLVYKGLTPGAFTLAPYLAQSYAASRAANEFWLGSWAGGYWYGFFPPEIDWSLVLQTAGLIMLAMAILASLIGIIVDPLQRALKLHHYRLNRLIAASGEAAMGERARGLRLADTILPRVIDAAETAIISLRIGP